MPKSLPLFGELDEDGKIITTDEPGKTTAETDEVVYSDDQIRIKIKPKAEGYDATKEPGKKRGRKPSTTPKVVKPKQKLGRPTNEEMEAKVELLNIPDDETLNKKLYWGITEVALMFGVNNSMIRFWANEFDIIKPRTSRKGDRHFRVEDIKNLQIIYNLLKNRKFSIEGAKKYLDGNKKKIDVNVQMSESLLKIKSFLIELKSNLGI